MPRLYRGISLTGIKEPRLRSILQEFDLVLRDMNADLSTFGAADPVSPGSAPDNLAYVTVGNTTSLSAERRIAASSPVTITDSGANGAVTIGLSAGTLDHGNLTGLGDDDHLQYLNRSGVRDMTGELGTDVGTFRSDVASGGVGFTFNTSNSFAGGSLFRVTDNGTKHFDISYEGHGAVGDGALFDQSSRVFDSVRALSADNRASFTGINTNVSVGGAIPGFVYSPALTGVVCAMTFNPSSFGPIGNRVLRGGQFAVSLSDGSATQTVQTIEGGRFSVEDSSSTIPVTTARCGRFLFNGPFAGGITNAYGVFQDPIVVGTNRWGANLGNRAVIDSPAADAQEVLGLMQSNTGATDGVHIKMNDKAGHATNTAAGDIYRTGDLAYFVHSTGTREPFRYALLAGS